MAHNSGSKGTESKQNGLPLRQASSGQSTGLTINIHKGGTSIFSIHFDTPPFYPPSLIFHANGPMIINQDIYYETPPFYQPPPNFHSNGFYPQAQYQPIYPQAQYQPIYSQAQYRPIYPQAQYRPIYPHYPPPHSYYSYDHVPQNPRRTHSNNWQNPNPYPTPHSGRNVQSSGITHSNRRRDSARLPQAQSSATQPAVDKNIFPPFNRSTPPQGFAVTVPSTPEAPHQVTPNFPNDHQASSTIAPPQSLPNTENSAAISKPIPNVIATDPVDAPAKGLYETEYFQRGNELHHITYKKEKNRSLASTKARYRKHMNYMGFRLLSVASDNPSILKLFPSVDSQPSVEPPLKMGLKSLEPILNAEPRSVEPPSKIKAKPVDPTWDEKRRRAELLLARQSRLLELVLNLEPRPVESPLMMEPKPVKLILDAESRTVEPSWKMKPQIYRSAAVSTLSTIAIKRSAESENVISHSINNNHGDEFDCGSNTDTDSDNEGDDDGKMDKEISRQSVLAGKKRDSLEHGYDTRFKKRSRLS
ncbi:hypothetical protein ACMFMG_004575 [Clarireedia jacksonii]